MGWIDKLRDELVSIIQPTGLTAYMVFDSQGGSGKNINIMKRDWQNQMIGLLNAAGIQTQLRTWDTTSYDDRGVLIMFFGNQITRTQIFKDMISKAASIKWILSMWEISYEIENFSLFSTKVIRDTDGETNLNVFKREKVNL